VFDSGEELFDGVQIGRMPANAVSSFSRPISRAVGCGRFVGLAAGVYGSTYLAQIGGNWKLLAGGFTVSATRAYPRPATFAM